jgi:membrane-associated protease RseP (regulator of RpoE activity)
VVVTQGVAEERKARPWLNALLFIATLTSLLYVGAGYALTDAGLLEVASPAQAIWFVIRHIHYGVPFALTLMSILLAHEFSHYFVSLRHGAPTSLPYFIPLPVSPFGTMGALIVQNSPMRDRRALVEIGAAGPIGGLVVAIPLLILGLTLSQVGEPPPGVEVAVQEGNSLLYLGLKYLVYGRILPSGGEDVWLNSVAFAAWAGLFVTMFNLLPIGQLDGGHVARGLLGERAKTLGHVIIGAVLIWGVWLLLQGNQGGQIWLTWGVLNLLLNREHPPLLNELTRLTPAHIVLGLVTFFLFIITFMPAPWQTITF